MTWVELNDIVRNKFRAEPLSVECGGTGASIAAEARKNLEIADITVGDSLGLGGDRTYTPDTYNKIKLGTDPSMYLGHSVSNNELSIIAYSTGDYTIAQGEDHNWRYWKFESGLAICMHAPNSAVITESKDSVASGGYRSENYDIDLPFPMKTGTAFGSFGGYLYELRTYLVESGTKLRMIAYTSTSGTISGYPRAVVIGMWK